MFQSTQFNGVACAAFLTFVAGGLLITKITGAGIGTLLGAAVGLYLLFSIKVVDQWQKVALLRFGRYQACEARVSL